MVTLLRRHARQLTFPCQSQTRFLVTGSAVSDKTGGVVFFLVLVISVRLVLCVRPARQLAMTSNDITAS